MVLKGLGRGFGLWGFGVNLTMASFLYKSSSYYGHYYYH